MSLRPKARTRKEIVRGMRRTLREIEQIFTDAEAWNEYSTARKNGADPIDPDPCGVLRRMATELKTILDADRGRGPIAGFSPALRRAAYRWLFERAQQACEER